MLVLFLLSFIFNIHHSHSQNKTCLSENQKPLFVFGDSLFDSGNNNYIKTTTFFQGNYHPYGKTFFKYPSGRISDGRVISDFIGIFSYNVLLFDFMRQSEALIRLTFFYILIWWVYANVFQLNMQTCHLVLRYTLMETFVNTVMGWTLHLLEPELCLKLIKDWYTSFSQYSTGLSLFSVLKLTCEIRVYLWKTLIYFDHKT